MIIVRQAIGARAAHENEFKAYTCNIYVRGTIRLRNIPGKVLGRTIDLNTTDNSARLFYRSESLSKYSVSRPGNARLDVRSNRTSGSNAYGLNLPQIVSFYQNVVNVGENLGARGFLSPLADDAPRHYNYSVLRTYRENGKEFVRLGVEPKFRFEPLFRGTMDLVKDDWHIRSLRLVLTRESQMEVLDTLTIDQQYVPAAGGWTLRQQEFYPDASLLGFRASGNFLQVFSNYNFQPAFGPGYFDDVDIRFGDSANKTTPNYWDTLRPVPLQGDEMAEFRKRDSLEGATHTRREQDSLDRVRNTTTIGNMLFSGKTYSKERTKTYVYAQPLIDVINYNTVEGPVVNISPELRQYYSGDRSLMLSPNLRYGFSNRHFNAHLTGNYHYGGQHGRTIYFSGGQRVFQFNNDQPITPRGNTIGTLMTNENDMKLYQAKFLRLGYSADVNDHFRVGATLEYQDRSPLENTSDYVILDYKHREYSANWPIEISSHNLEPDKAFMATEYLTWQPGARFIEYPDKKVYVGSSLPTFGLSLTQGLHGVFGSDVDYSKWLFTAKQDIGLQMAGRVSYRFMMGGFFNASKVYLPDYQHFVGNNSIFSGAYLLAFQLAPYYQYSNTSSFFTSLNAEYHLNGLLSNKVPLMRKLNWFFVVGANGLYVNSNTYYYEGFFSIENILRTFRLDFIKSFESPNPVTGVRGGIYAIRIGIPVVLGGGED